MKEVPNLDICIGKYRAHMPQIEDFKAFLKDLEENSIEISDPATENTNALFPTQKNFNWEKVESIASSDKKIHPIIITKDLYVLDGHHRWLGAHNKDGKVEVRKIDLNIDEALKFLKGKPYVENRNINEQLDEENIKVSLAKKAEEHLAALKAKIDPFSAHPQRKTFYGSPKNAMQQNALEDS